MTSHRDSSPYDFRHWLPLTKHYDSGEADVTPEEVWEHGGALAGAEPPDEQQELAVWVRNGGENDETIIVSLMGLAGCLGSIPLEKLLTEHYDCDGRNLRPLQNLRACIDRLIVRETQLA